MDKKIEGKIKRNEEGREQERNREKDSLQHTEKKNINRREDKHGNGSLYILEDCDNQEEKYIQRLYRSCIN